MDSTTQIQEERDSAQGTFAGVFLRSIGVIVLMIASAIFVAVHDSNELARQFHTLNGEDQEQVVRGLAQIDKAADRIRQATGEEPNAEQVFHALGNQWPQDVANVPFRFQRRYAYWKDLSFFNASSILLPGKKDEFGKVLRY